MANAPRVPGHAPREGGPTMAVERGRESSVLALLRDARHDGVDLLLGSPCRACGQASSSTSSSTRREAHAAPVHVVLEAPGGRDHDVHRPRELLELQPVGQCAPPGSRCACAGWRRSRAPISAPAAASSRVGVSTSTRGPCRRGVRARTGAAARAAGTRRSCRCRSERRPAGRRPRSRRESPRAARAWARRSRGRSGLRAGTGSSPSVEKLMENLGWAQRKPAMPNRNDFFSTDCERAGESKKTRL